MSTLPKEDKKQFQVPLELELQSCESLYVSAGKGTPKPYLSLEFLMLIVLAL